MTGELIPRLRLRDDLCERLKQQSVLLYGARRVGKSTLLEMLADEPPSGWRVVRVDLEGRLADPISGLADEVGARLVEAGLLSRESVLARVSAVQIAGTGIELREARERGGWARLEGDVAAALAGMGSDGLVIALDEVPWWIDAIADQAGAAAGRAALASLRRIRQGRVSAERLRFVLTGSIGLGGLAAELGASAELNDLATLIVDPMTIDEAATLFETAVTERGRYCDAKTARYAARTAGGSPHWVKVLAAHVGPEGARSEADVDRSVAALLEPAQRKVLADEGSEHFRRRHPNRIAAMTAILEAHSAADSCGSREAAITAALAAQPSFSRAEARECLDLLIDGFYLKEEPTGALTWVNPLLRRWWLRYGGL